MAEGGGVVPGKRDRGRQMGKVNDPATVDGGLNIDPDDFRVGSAEMFAQATEQTRMALCISDPQLPDCPIVYVNEAFVQLTGYPRDEIVGRNCRFLQGKDTDPKSVERLRDAIEAEEYIVVDILNYRKDGTPFWNAVHVGPILDEDGKLAYYYGSQWDITELLSEREKSLAQERVSRELRHRTDNLFAVINAMIRMSSRKETDVGDFAEKVTERISALANAHRVSIPDSPDEEGTDLRSLVDAVLKPYRNRHADRLEIEGEPVLLAPRTVTALGLTLHELATNALKYGGLGASTGRVHVNWGIDEGRLRLTWREEGAEGANSDMAQITGSGAGKMLMDGMLQSLSGIMQTRMEDGQFSARIELPVGEVAFSRVSEG